MTSYGAVQGHIFPGGGRKGRSNEREADMARKSYWVQWLDERWKVRHQQTTLTTHVIKADAVEAGEKAAKADQPSELFICRKDGTIEDRRTYGQDPYPPKG
jgi:hypothetical protein